MKSKEGIWRLEYLEPTVSENYEDQIDLYYNKEN